MTTDSPPSLLAPDEPAPFEWIGRDLRSAPLLICDHASNFIPRALADLGLPAPELERHIAYDLGAAEVTRGLAQRLGCAALLSHFSRLVVDPNRALDDPTLMPRESDGTPVPGNQHLTHAARQQRLATLFHPYHQALSQALAERVAAGVVPVILSIHSFTPVMQGRARPWQIGILWNRDPRLAVPLMADLNDAGFIVGDNEPYSGRDNHGFTLRHHAHGAGFPHVLLELRQDLIDTHHGAQEWIAILAPILAQLLTRPSLTQTKVFP